MRKTSTRGFFFFFLLSSRQIGHVDGQRRGRGQETSEGKKRQRPGIWGVDGMRRCRSGPPRPISTQEQGRDRALPDCGGRGEVAYGLGPRALCARNDVKLDPVAFI